MKGKWRTVAIVVLSVALAIGIGGMIYTKIESNTAIAEYDEALQIVELPDFSNAVMHDKVEETDIPSISAKEEIIEDMQTPTTDVPKPETPSAEELYMNELAEMDISSLKSVNADVLGWIVIPNTTISYPLMQGDDNQYYLKHTWKKKWNTAGAIYLDYRNDSCMEDFNSIIYGHRRKDNTMFSPLLSFKEQEHVNENPFVYIVTKQGVFQYAIFSTHYDNVKGDSWKIGQKTDESKQAYIDYCLEKSLVSAMVTPRPDDKILTLSTCSGMGDDSIRFLVHGVLINN